MKKKVVYDMALNIISSAIPTIVLQILVLPALAKYMDGQQYGLVITLLSLLNVVPGTIGVVLNNVRLMHEETYKDNKLKGDFQILLFVYELINALVILVMACYYMGIKKWIDIIFLIAVAIICGGREYYLVGYRIDLNYKAVFLNNLILVLGYIIGFCVYRVTGYWQWIYFIGYTFSLGYLLFSSNLWQEPFTKTVLFKQVCKDTVFMLIATFLARSISYADKLILYPILGGEQVSIYYIATLFGKVISLAVTPINSVALSYLSKINKKPDSLFKWAYCVGGTICFGGYFLILFLSRPVLSILYPDYVDEAMKYIFITSATVMIGVLASIVTPFVLKFYDTKWQIWINGFTAGCYVIISLYLLERNGLTGFCAGMLIANIVKLLVTTFIYIFMKERTYEINQKIS